MKAVPTFQETETYLMGREGLSRPAFDPAVLHCPGWGAWYYSVERGLGVPLSAGDPPGCAGSAASPGTL